MFFLDCASLRLSEALEIFADNGERVGDVSPAFGFHVKNMSLGGGIAPVGSWNVMDTVWWTQFPDCLMFVSGWWFGT